MAEQTGDETLINNSFYDELMDKWYQGEDHPVALLRAENLVRNPWIIESIESKKGKNQRVLDMGCGGGLLSNALAKKGHRVTGIDLSEKSLEIARKFDETKTAEYLNANAYKVPFEAGTFDVVSAMDVLEHVTHPQKLIKEASRVLKPGGLFFFHTFNRNLLSYLMIIKGVEWCVKNTPDNMHIYHLFISPKELGGLCDKEGLTVDSFIGLRPKISHPSFWKMLMTRKVPKDFSFTFSRNLLTGYCGIATKN